MSKPRAIEFCPACGIAIGHSDSMTAYIDWFKHLTECGVIEQTGNHGGSERCCACSFTFRHSNKFSDHVRAADHDWAEFQTMKTLKEM